MSTQGAPAPAPAPGFFAGLVTSVRNLDIRKVATAIVVLGALEHGIVIGEVPLNDAVPASWIPHIVAWCKILVWLNPFLLAGHSFTALKWPQPKQPGGFNATAVIAWFVIGTALLLAHPGAALAARKAVPTPAPRPQLCDPLNLLPGCRQPNGQPAPAGAVDPLAFLRQFSYTDVQNALNDANGQNPPNKTSAQCWTYLLTLLPAPAPAATGAPATGAAATPAPANPATSLLPAVPGVASAIQKALDDQQLVVTWLSPGGGLEQLNLACAPLINMLNVRLLSGGAVTAAGAAALSNPATAPIIAGVQALLGGAIALVPK